MACPFRSKLGQQPSGMPGSKMVAANMSRHAPHPHPFDLPSKPNVQSQSFVWTIST